MNILTTGLVVFFLLIIFALAVAAMLLVKSLINREAPFISVPKAILPEIVRALNIEDTSRVYDLGCGDGRVLLACYKQNPKAAYIGIDKSILPFLIARFKIQRHKPRLPIRIIRQNFFKTDFSSATHIFIYLFSTMMEPLFKKLQQELKPGTRLVSCDFKFKNKEPLEIIDLRRSSRSLGQKLYVYEF